MKNQRIIRLFSLGFTLVSALLFSSCENKNTSPVTPPEADNESVISYLEGNDVELFKKTILVRDGVDGKGENYVLLEIAAKSQSLLDEYLGSTKISLTTGSETFADQGAGNNNSEQVIGFDEIKKVDIYENVLDKKMAEGIKSYTIRYTSKNSGNPNARSVGSYEYDSFHDSNKFDDWMAVTRSDMNDYSAETAVKVTWYNRQCAFCGWNEGPSVLLLEGSDNYDSYDVDARRPGCRVWHNYGNYSVTHGNF